MAVGGARGLCRRCRWRSGRAGRCGGGRHGGGGAGLDDHHAGRLRLGGGEGEEGAEAAADAVTPDVAALVRRCRDLLAEAPGAGVEGGQEAVVLVGEVLVEGGTGDARPFDHVLDVGRAVAEFGDRPQHADQEALALDRPDQVTGQPARPGGEATLAVGEQLGRGLDQLRWPVVTEGGDQKLPADLISVG